MITDFLIKLVLGIVKPVLDLLPVSHLSLPDPTSIADFLSSVDYLIPIIAVMRVAAGVLSLLALFFTVRFFVFLWQQVKW